MNKNNKHHKIDNFYRLQCFTSRIACILLIALSGCNLTPAVIVEPVPLMSNYYQWLKTQQPSVIGKELHQQRQVISDNPTSYRENIKLLLLYAVPHSPEHNPFSAKTMINQLDKDNLLEQDAAFIQLLADQLNQQILTLNKNKALLKDVEELQLSQQNLVKQVDKLTNQITQLKKIELDIQEQKR